MTRDPYAALRTLNLQQGPGTQTPMIGSGDSQEWSGQMMDMPGAWDNPDWRSPELGVFHRKGDTHISDRGDGTLEVSGLQYPGGSRRDQLRAIYRQDPATGKWVMQGDPQLYKDKNRGWDKAKTPAALAAMVLSAGAAGGAFSGAAASGSGAAPAAAGGIKTLPGAASLGTMPAPLSPIVTGGALAPMAPMPAWVTPAKLVGAVGSAALPAAASPGGASPPTAPAPKSGGGGLPDVLGDGLEWVSDSIGLPEGVGDLLGNSSVVRDLMGLASAGVSQWNIEKMADDNRKWQSGERQKDRDHQDKKEADARARRAPVGGTAGALRVMRGG